MHTGIICLISPECADRLQKGRNTVHRIAILDSYISLRHEVEARCSAFYIVIGIVFVLNAGFLIVHHCMEAPRTYYVMGG